MAKNPLILLCNILPSSISNTAINQFREPTAGAGFEEPKIALTQTTKTTFFQKIPNISISYKT